MDSAVKAVYFEMIGQTFAVLGMAIAKLSLGTFFLRIVIVTWQRISIWFWMTSLSIISVLTAIVFWIQRLPSESIYDPRVPGHSVVGVTIFAVLLGGKFAVLLDYFYEAYADIYSMQPGALLWTSTLLFFRGSSSGILTWCSNER